MLCSLPSSFSELFEDFFRMCACGKKIIIYWYTLIYNNTRLCESCKCITTENECVIKRCDIELWHNSNVSKDWFKWSTEKTGWIHFTGRRWLHLKLASIREIISQSLLYFVTTMILAIYFLDLIKINSVVKEMIRIKSINASEMYIRVRIFSLDGI